MEREYPPRYVHEPSHPAPPLYEAHDHHELQDQAVVDPTIFILAGQSIHVKTLDSPPVYALSRSVAALSKATKQVEFERLDNVIRACSTQEATTVPILKCRHRHLYDLRRTVKQPRIGLSRSRASSDAPEYYIHSMSRRTLGHVGLRKCSHGGFAAGFSAVPVRMDASQARFANEGKPLFMLQHHGDRSHWLSVEHGNIVAIEDAADDQKRLIIMKAMPRSEVDALVALWCCRIWQHAAAKVEAARREVEGSFILKKVALGQAVYRGRV